MWARRQSHDNMLLLHILVLLISVVAQGLCAVWLCSSALIDVVSGFRRYGSGSLVQGVLMLGLSRRQ